MGKAWLSTKSDRSSLSSLKCMYGHVGGCRYYQLVLKILLFSSALFILSCFDWVCSPGVTFLSDLLLCSYGQAQCGLLVGCHASRGTNNSGWAHAGGSSFSCVKSSRTKT